MLIPPGGADEVISLPPLAGHCIRAGARAGGVGYIRGRGCRVIGSGAKERRCRAIEEGGRVQGMLVIRASEEVPTTR